MDKTKPLVADITAIRCDRCGNTQPLIRPREETSLEVKGFFRILSLNGLGLLCFECKPAKGETLLD